MCLLFAATHPELVSALVLYGGMARSTWAPDYPWASPADALLESSMEMAPYLLEGAALEIMAPSIADDPQARQAFARYQRYATTPSMLQQNFLMFLDIDVRSILPSVEVPTLVLHRRGDMAVNRRAAEWMAGQIPGAKYVELPGNDHLLYVGDSDRVLDEIEEFLTGGRRAVEIDRVLATVMFTDIVDSTQRASTMGDRAWRDLLDAQNDVLRHELTRFRGHEIKTLGDGMLATFDGPARAIRCALAITEAVRPLGIEVRVGLHTGEVELVGDDDVAGIAVHIAARVGAKATAGEVLVSGTVKDLVAGSGIGFADRGEHVLKGIPDEWRLFAVEPNYSSTSESAATGQASTAACTKERSESGGCSFSTVTVAVSSSSKYSWDVASHMPCPSHTSRSAMIRKPMSDLLLCQRYEVDLLTDTAIGAAPVVGNLGPRRAGGEAF